MAVADRLETLLSQNVVTGIDFVYVYADQVTLDVYFLRSPSTLTVPLVNNIPISAIRIYSQSGGERLPEVPVNSISWAIGVGGRDVLRVKTAFPGDFSRYRFHLEDARIDRFFNDVFFSFKANCESDLDCKLPGGECPAEPPVDFPVDYTARDFWSFRRALLDFASERYPRWQDRVEADFGVMMAELMSALGDEFAYYQDRIGREAYLETATQRRSLRRLANLVDYNIHDGLGASTWLDFQVNADSSIQAGTLVTDTTRRVQFEVGRGLAESFAIPPQLPKFYAVAVARNLLFPHQWDEDDLCLPAGATELYLNGHHKADLPLDDITQGKASGKWVLLQTKPINPAIAARVWPVRLIAVEDTTDVVFGQNITRLRWEPEQATPFEMDLTVLEIHGNILPATAGATFVRRFTIGASGDETDRPSAVEREGPDESVACLLSLNAVLPDIPGSDEIDLVWLGEVPETAAPEIRLAEVKLAGNVWNFIPNGEWVWRRVLLGTNSAQPNDRVFTLDDGLWRRVVGYQRIGKQIVHQDYATDSGKTIRFGDGEFGMVPTDSTIFQVIYRLGNGKQGNITAGTLTRCALASVASVTNPLPAINGTDPETPEQVRQIAPEAFRAITFRAVRPEDYAEAAERLGWVQRAGAEFRWTGSWLTAYVTPDPKGAVTVSAAQGAELNDQISRFRQAGRPAYMLNPRYANLDLEISVCVEPFAYRGEVKERVLEALFGAGGIRPRQGFFSPDNFTFGTPLERSVLEAVIQEVEGVRAVEEMRIRRRGWFGWRNFIELTYRIADNEVIRLENNALLPERGSVKLFMKGGA
ncbi:MAG: hypothetical protein WBV94_23860 [Blastocatellia bacterium]